MILRLRFVQRLKQREIADEMGLSQVQVSRLLSRAMNTLHESVLEEAS